MVVPMGTEAGALPEIPAAQRREEVKRHVRGLIDAGALRRGSRLPSILELSRTLGVAKNTVIAALDQVYRQLDVLAPAPGAGTRVDVGAAWDRKA